MSETRQVLVERDDDDLVVRSPLVGWWCGPPRPGQALGPGGRVGSLVQLNRRYLLELPEGIQGLVDDEIARARVVPVEHGQRLFRLRERAPGGAGRAKRPTRSASTDARENLPRGAHPVVAPTDGVFYRRPSPQAPPFVEVGGQVVVGQPVGLVEVMKTFNQIVYGGAGWPERAEVLEIRCEDAEEVRAGQVLLVVRG